MAPLSGVASYKKKDGILILSKDEKTLTWVAAAGPQMIIPVSTITSMRNSFGYPTVPLGQIADNAFRPATDSRHKPQGDAQSVRHRSECPTK